MDKYKDTELIAGVATGAIGIGMLVAQKLDLPFVYVRPEAKKHGRKNQVEAKVMQNQKVVVIEDLISTGKSSLAAVDALKSAGATVKGMVAIFSYGFEVSKKNFDENKLDLYTLSNYENLLEQALDTNFINEKESNMLSQWNANPSEWS